MTGFVDNAKAASVTAATTSPIPVSRGWFEFAPLRAAVPSRNHTSDAVPKKAAQVPKTMWIHRVPRPTVRAASQWTGTNIKGNGLGAIAISVPRQSTQESRATPIVPSIRAIRAAMPASKRRKCLGANR